MPHAAQPSFRLVFFRRPKSHRRSGQGSIENFTSDQSIQDACARAHTHTTQSQLLKKDLLCQQITGQVSSLINAYGNNQVFLFWMFSWWTKDTIAVVTGGNKGIGFEIVKQLAQKGLTVVLTARNAQNGLVATEKLKNEGLNVVFHILDVLSTASVSQLANWLKQQYNGLDILFNNAAITDYEPGFTAAQSVLETNYEAVKRTTQQLLPLLRPTSAGARIVNVSSLLGQLMKLKDPVLREEMGDLETLTEEKVDKFLEKYLQDVKEQRLDGSGWPIRSYSISKVALNAYTRVLAKALKDRPDGQHIYANCATPGYCKTDLTRNRGIYTAEQGAETPVWVALLPPNGPTGQFFSEKNVVEF